MNGLWGIMAMGMLMTVLNATAEAQRKEILIDAADLAPAEQRADEPVAGKWWLRHDVRDWGAPKGTILLTGEIADKPGPGEFWDIWPAKRFVAYQVPALTVEPKATGWYRIYAGLYHEPDDPGSRLLARLSREPYGEFLQAPQHTTDRTAEVYWKAADLTGQRIHLEQPQAPIPHPGRGWLGGITHLRLVPIPAAELAAAKQETGLPPARQRLFGMLDYTDEIWWWGYGTTEEDMRAIVYRHAQAGFGRLYWRAFGTHLDNSRAVPEANPRWTEADEQSYLEKQQCGAAWMPYIDIARRYDPLKVAVEYGKKIDCEVHAWVRLTNFNRAPYAEFWHDHPEFYAQMLVTEKDPKTGEQVPVKPYQRKPYPRVMSFAYPEVRTFYVKVFRQLAASGTRGIMIDLLRHPPVAGFEPVVTEAFQKKYGMAMEERNLYKDPLVQEHLSEYLRLFLVELRQSIGKEIELSVRCSGPSNYALRGKEWIAAGLINSIVDGNWYSGNGPRPTIADTVEAAGSRGKAYAVAEPNDVDSNKDWSKRDGYLMPETILVLAMAYTGRGVAGFGLYESTVFTWYPDIRRAIRAAGWSYDPENHSDKPGR